MTPSTFPSSFSDGCSPAPGETACCWRGATASPFALRPPRRRWMSSSGGPDATRERTIKYEAESEEHPVWRRRPRRRGPVLLAVTPPRTGERTLLGVENLLQSIAVPEPFSLELAGDMDRRHSHGAAASTTRWCAVSSPPHYPQARIQQVDPRRRPAEAPRGRKRLVRHPAGRRDRSTCPSAPSGTTTCSTPAPTL